MKKSYTSWDGHTIWYLEYLPADYDGTKTYPLIVFLHGVGEIGADDGSQLILVTKNGPPMLIQGNNDMCFTTPSGKQCFIVLSPQTPTSRGWVDDGDTGAMLTYALETYKVDPKRVYLTGLSMGGGSVWTTMTRTVPNVAPQTYWGSLIAAAVPVAGAAGAQYFNTTICDGIVRTHLPVWTFQGETDTTVSLSDTQAWVDKVNGTTTAGGYSCSTPTNPLARITVYPSVGHWEWIYTYDPAQQVESGRNLYQWLLTQHR